MQARTVLLTLFFALPFTTSAAEVVARIVVQRSSLAGLRYYDGAAVWDEMRAGDALVLVREPGNPHDANAIRIEWRGRVLGYVPRRENAHLARQMDFGAAPAGRIVALERHRNGRKRLTYEILVPLTPVSPQQQSVGDPATFVPDHGDHAVE